MKPKLALALLLSGSLVYGQQQTKTMTTRKSVVKLLIARKADATIKDKRCFDAFLLAEQLEDPEILDLLKQAPAGE
jgi:hypothetical protein